PAGAGGHHGDALRRLRRRRMVRVRLPGMGPDLLGVVADPRPDLHDLRGVGLRSVDADALGAAPDAAADVLRCGARAVLLRGALDPPVRRTRPAAPTHPAGPGTRRGRAGPRRGVTKLAPPLPPRDSALAAVRCARRL